MAEAVHDYRRAWKASPACPTARRVNEEQLNLQIAHSDTRL